MVNASLKGYRTLPAIPTGYPLYERCPFGIVIPYARRNEVTNPSVETNTTGYTAGAGTLARTTADQYHGAYSLIYTPSAAVNDGFYYGTISMTAGQTRAISCKFKGVGGKPYKLSVATTGGVDLVTYNFRASGRWQWIWLFWTETTTTTRRIYFTKDNDAGVLPFYVDGVQSEVCGSEGVFVTTFIDGDQQGLVPNQFPPAYYWEGTPHASASQRSGQTRAGGRVLSFSRFGFLLAAIIGLGLVPPQHIVNQYAQLDGANYDRTRKPLRQFSLAGRMNDASAFQMARQRGEFQDLFDRDRIAEQQPLMLCYQQVDCYDERVPTTRAALIPSIYVGGLEGNTNNLFAEQQTITFTQFLPFILGEFDQGTTLSPQTSVNNANAVITRSPSGVWSAMSTGMSGGAASVYAIARGLDGIIYAAGDFTDAGGSGADYIAKWDGSNWSVLQSATAINGPVFALAVGPDGRIYVGGNFTNAGGDANADYVAVYNPATNTYSALGTGLDAVCNALAFTPSGTLYATGGFATAGGGAARRIALWNGSAWSALSTGLDPAGPGVGLALAVAPDGSLYVGGGFTNAGGTVVNYIAKWDGSAFSALAGGMNNVVRSIAVAPNGRIYAGGDFTTAGGVTANRIAVWNSVSWTALGTGISGSVSKIAVQDDGLVLVGGAFTVAGGITIPDSFAIWNGGGWTYADVDLPSTPNTFGILVAPDNTIYLGFTTAGTATAGSVTTITNSGTARSYPTVIIKGPSSGTARIFRITNTTTGRVIYMNYTINAGETATLIFDPSNLSFTSDFQGNIASTILPGSNEADFFLQPGDNTIAFLANSTTMSTVFQWKPTFASLDDVARMP